MLLRAARVPDLRRKLALTIGLLLAYRVGSMVPAPGVSYRAVHACVGGAGNAGLYGMVNLFSGGALLQLSLFALGVMPYVTASIILQLLTAVVPRLAALRRDGPTGSGKITQYTRYLTVALAAVQGGGLVYVARGTPSRLFPSCPLPVVPGTSALTAVTLLLALVAGTVLVMWIGETITSRGIGNGISLLMMTAIAARLPSQGLTLARTHSPLVLAGAAALTVALVAAVVVVEQAQRRIPVTFAAKTAAPLAGGGTYLPLKVNQAGVVPVIFASSLLYMPTVAVQWLGADSGFGRFVERYLARGDHPVYLATYLTLVVFFTFFAVAMTYNPHELADDLRAAGGFIPGVRPGPPTAGYLDYVLTRLTVAGAGYLGLVALLPLLLLAASGGVNQLPLGGTSLLILVGVGLETVKQLDAQLMQRRYPGFLSTPPAPETR